MKTLILSEEQSQMVITYSNKKILEKGVHAVQMPEKELFLKT